MNLFIRLRHSTCALLCKDDLLSCLGSSVSRAPEACGVKILQSSGISNTFGQVIFVGSSKVQNVLPP